MFPGKDILRSAVLVAIGGIVALLVSKLLEGEEGVEAEKQPREHDERTC